MYRAERTPVFNSPAAFAEILGGYAATEPLKGHQTADIVIIGAGFAGVSAARRLLQIDPTLNITILDALRIGEGSAGRNSGFMIDLPHNLASDDYAGGGNDRQMTALNREAIAFARDAVAEYAINPAFADPVGKVNGAATAAGEAHNKNYAAHLVASGEPLETLDAADMYALTGSRHYRSGLFTPGTLMLQPAGYIKGLAAGLRRNGVQIFEQSAVISFNRQGTDWQVTTQRGTINAGKIIMANNGHLESFGIAKGQLMQVFLYASMTRELSAGELRTLGGASRWGVTPSDPMGTTMRRIDTAQGGNRIITRTCATMQPLMQTPPRQIARASAVQRRKFNTRFPKLVGIPMQYEWAGHLCLSLNGVSVTRQLEDGIYAACVQNGLGTARGTLTGIAAAEMLMGQTSEITRYFETEEPPKRLPPQPVARWGANVYLRWKEWRAGAE